MDFFSYFKFFALNRSGIIRSSLVFLHKIIEKVRSLISVHSKMSSKALLIVFAVLLPLALSAKINNPKMTIPIRGGPIKLEPCPRIYLPVCGSDGITYGNSCELKNAQKKNSNLSMVRNGKCIGRGPIVCDTLFEPVCGCDGKTYGNSCEFKSANQNNPRATYKEGACPKVQKPKICSYIYAPVCGSDGTTYANSCSLENAQIKNPKLTMVHKGECDEEVEDKQDEDIPEYEQEEDVPEDEQEGDEDEGDESW